MRFPKFQALLAIFALAFSAGVFAQDYTPLSADQIEQLEEATDLNDVVESLIDGGADASAVAAALAARGLTDTQITIALNAAGVTGQALGVALINAGAVRDLTQPGSDQTTTEEVVEVTGSGLLIGADGRAVVVQSIQDQMRLAGAFIAASVQQNPNFFSNNAVASGLTQVITTAIMAANPGANPGAVAQAVLAALQNADFGTGGNATTVLAQALQNAANNAGVVLPPVSPS